jgi:hypothetical protein
MPAFSQFERLKGNWISEANEMIAIHDTAKPVNYVCNSKLKCRNFYLKNVKDTIRFQSRYYTSKDKYKKLNVDNFNMLIVELNDSVLRVKPVAKGLKDHFGTSGIIKFKKQEYIRDKDFKLDKIIFHASGCYGTCPIIDMEISGKEIKLHIVKFDEGSHLMRDTERSGYFTGKLSDEQYKELVSLLVRSKIDEINIDGQMLCCDGAVKTIITYHNGGRNYVKTMFEPRILDELVNFLYKVTDTVSLERTNEIFEFEK